VASSQAAAIASVQLSEMMMAGQNFLPAAQAWNNQNMAAQWFSSVNVNMISIDFENAPHHGGLPNFSAMIHDHGHTYSRFLAIKRAMLLSPGQHDISSGVNFREFSAKAFKIGYFLDYAVARAQSAMVTKPIDQLKLGDGIFMFFHEPQVMTEFLMQIKAGQKNWDINSPHVIKMAQELEAIAISEKSFFPILADPDTRIMQEFISQLGNLAVAGPLSSLLRL